ncbi:unnamed protein product [Alopecurus aequalis]
MDMDCDDRRYVFLLLMFTALVQIAGTNCSAVVAVNDGDGEKMGPSIELLARTLWTSYLVFYYVSRGNQVKFDTAFQYLTIRSSVSLIAHCVLSLVKVSLKFYTFYKARRSFALGRNARLVAGYMGRLQEESHRSSEDELTPLLLVMGEENQKIEEVPHGYDIKSVMTNNSLVTIDRVWRVASTGDIILASRPHLTDLCLSFALSKLLRRRFAKCHLAESGSTKAFNFVLDVLLSNRDADRVFRLIEDEASFLGDSYYSSLPASYSGKFLSILNITVSLSVIITCCLAAIESVATDSSQISCYINSCEVKHWDRYYSYDTIDFGNILFHSMPTFILVVATIVGETWEIVSYICSNWLKVTLVCSYITHVSWHQSPHMQRWIGLVLGFRVNWTKGWNDQMGQISLLAQPQVEHFVKVPTEVKAAIVDALRRSNGILSNGTLALGESGIAEHILWACQGEGTSDVILVWHIATSIFKAKHVVSKNSLGGKNSSVADHMSQYCVYLMVAAPQLMPDEKAWSNKLYKTVRKYVDRIGADKFADYNQMIAQLTKISNEHDVVKRGLKLGNQLVELIPDEEVGWGILARFWSEMILYIAPSDNLKAHKEAIARGGEPLTLVWALLTHAGITTRPNIRTVV